jgi:uncharacterized protein (DUF488 family)
MVRGKRNPSPPFRGEREGPAPQAWEGEEGASAAQASGIPHLTPTLSARGGGEGVLFTIGYEKTRLADVIAILKEARVATVIDVRDRPISRRPGFSKRQLAAALEEAGIAYVGMKALGTPPEGREANHRRDWGRFWAIVEEKLATGEAQLALEQTAGIAQAAPSCLLCYEADWRICHRRRVAEMLAARHDFKVHHLAVPVE